MRVFFFVGSSPRDLEPKIEDIDPSVSLSRACQRSGERAGLQAQTDGAERVIDRSKGGRESVSAVPPRRRRARSFSPPLPPFPRQETPVNGARVGPAYLVADRLEPRDDLALGHGGAQRGHEHLLDGLGGRDGSPANALERGRAQGLLALRRGALLLLEDGLHGDCCDARRMICWVWDSRGAGRGAIGIGDWGRGVRERALRERGQVKEDKTKTRARGCPCLGGAIITHLSWYFARDE